MVYNTASQRYLGTDYYQLNTLFPGYTGQPLNVIRIDIQVMAKLCRTGITRSGINLVYLGALSQLPDQGMLPGPTPDNQYFNLPHPLKSPSPSKERGRVI